MNKCQPARIKLYRFCILLLLAIAVTVVYSGVIAPRYRWYINLTDSLPGRLYLVNLASRAPRRGELVAFRPPPTPAYPRHAVFLKYALGLPGDRVDTGARQWQINRQLLGRIKTRAYSGRRLLPGPEGRIPAGYYAMWGPGVDSYDSRYRDIGWIGHDRIIGFAYRVF